MEKFLVWARSEVASVSSFIIALLAALPIFGVSISAEQNGALVGLSAIVLGMVTRSKVTSEKGLIAHDAKRDALVGEYLKAAAANK